MKYRPHSHLGRHIGRPLQTVWTHLRVRPMRRGGFQTLPYILIVIVVLIAACTPEEPIEEPLPTNELILFPTATTTPHPTRTQTPEPTTPPTQTNTPIPTPTPTVTPIPMVELVIAVNPIPAGYPIPPDAVQVYRWPAEAAPFGLIETVDEVINEVALVDIFCYQPILTSTIARREAGSGYFDMSDRCPSVPQLEAPILYTDVAFAVQYIPIGETITPDMIAFRPWPQLLAPSNAVNDFMDVVGSVSLVEILQEQPLLLDYFDGG